MSGEKVNSWGAVRAEAPSVYEANTHRSVSQHTPHASLGAYRSYISFGDVPVNTQRTELVTFTNEGRQNLRIDNIQTGNSNYRILENSLSIPPGESRMLRIIFNPYFAQTYSTTLSFSSNDPEHSQGSIFLTGRGIPN